MTENNRPLPSLVDYFNPVLRALHELGGTGSNQEIHDRVVFIMGLTNDEIRQPYFKSGQTTTKVAYRMGWARTYLKQYGLIVNTGRAWWSLTEQGRDTNEVDPHEVFRVVREMQIARSDAKPKAADAASADAVVVRDGLPAVVGDGAITAAKDSLPPAHELLIPAIQALRELGGTARKRDISARVKELTQLSDWQTQSTYGGGKTTVYSILINEVRKTLFAHGLISFPQSGVYQLTDAGWTIEESEIANIPQSASRRRSARTAPPPKPANLPTIPIDQLVGDYVGWREQLSQLLQSLSAAQVERLFLRIFQDEGIDQVEILQSGHGADIEGSMSSGGFITFRVHFKFVRGNPQLSSQDVEDFRRSAQVAGADKAMLITTGAFTSAAHRAVSSGSSPKVELVNGEQLIDALRNLGMGVRTEKVIVERVIIDEGWFGKLG